ncbi:MAG TPA: methionyl-tRNA formyltransferase [Candidatus Microsaccharimonas sp.]|jgi:methionyl-tRNA formyltransferase
MSKTIIFFGTDTFSAAALRSLIEAEYIISAVVTKPDSKSGRGQQLVAPLVKQIAQEHGIPVWQPTKLIEIADAIVALGDVIGVLSSYGRIVPQAIIDLFRPGIINIHPSLLPLYRGPSPIETAIMNGDTQTGVSIMKLTAEMDAGPVYAQEVYPLDGTETAPELYETLSALGGRMLIETLPSIIEGNLLPSPQTNAAIFCYLLKKEDALLQPDEMTAVQAERQVRAYLVFPKTKLLITNRDKKESVIVTKAHIASDETNDKDFIVAFKNDSYLIIDELIGPSGKRMSGQAFKNGYAA